MEKRAVKVGKLRLLQSLYILGNSIDTLLNKCFFLYFQLPLILIAHVSPYFSKSEIYHFSFPRNKDICTGVNLVPAPGIDSVR